jgi:hypothetical protein
MCNRGHSSSKEVLHHHHHHHHHHHLTYFLLTPWSRVILEKLTGLQVVKKFPILYGIRRFITAFTSARHLSLSRASSIQSIPHIPLPEDPTCINLPSKPGSPKWSRTKSHVPFSLLRSYQSINPGPK